MRTILVAMLIAFATPASALQICHIAVDDPTAFTPSLNMRVLPDPTSSIIGDLDNGEHVLILELKGRWAYVRNNRLGRGWMAWQSGSGKRYIGNCFNWDGHSNIDND